jgi:hypothetical protein
MPLRVLQLYITVATADDSPTPMRMKPLTVVLMAPPNNFAWGESSEVIDTVGMTLANPMIQKIATNTNAFVYNAPSSNALWCSARAFRGEPGSASAQRNTTEVVAGSITHRSGYMEVIS